MKITRIEELLIWVMNKLQIHDLGYSFSNRGDRPFEFRYPSSEEFEMAWNHLDCYAEHGHIYPI